MNTGIDCFFLSETSHTQRASSVVSKRFASYAYKVVWGCCVQDRFAKRNRYEGFRGKSSGVATICSLPVYPSVGIIPSKLWMTSRIQHVNVVVGHICVRVVNVYLKPHATVGSDEFELNTLILDFAVQVLSGVHGPAMLVGDFNSSWDKYQPTQQVMNNGWEDLALLHSRRAGCPAKNTCRDAARHTFALVNPDFVPFFVDSDVIPFHAFDSHDLLVVTCQLRGAANHVYKWPHPSSFENQIFDREVLHKAAERKAASMKESFQYLLQQNPDKALKSWAVGVESVFQDAHCDAEGFKARLGKRFLGRCQAQGPVRKSASEPRVKVARAGDFSLEYDTPSVQVRQRLKQVRRLQSLLRCLKKWRVDCCDSVLAFKIKQLWDAICKASGYGQFTVWAFHTSGISLNSPWQPQDQLEHLYQIMQDDVKALNTKLWSLKNKRFKASLESSFLEGGGSLPFALVKPDRKPCISELKSTVKLVIPRQRWQGKTQFSFLAGPNHGLLPGDIIESSRDTWQIKRVVQRRIFLHKGVNLRDLASLRKVTYLVDRDDIAKEFFQGWNSFWQRDAIDEPLWADAARVLNSLPDWPALAYTPISVDDWQLALRSTKSKTMRGADSFTTRELQLVPIPLVKMLLEFYNQVECTGLWPSLLREWFVILLRKEDGPITWKGIRPISVAALLYRIYAKIRAKQILAHARQFLFPYVGVHISTAVLWTTISELIADAHATNTPAYGLVFDIVEAFNSLSRPVVFGLAKKCGIPPAILSAWEGAMVGINRRCIISGSIHLQANSTTGFPEGCPLSVSAMLFITWAFALTIKNGVVGVLPFTFADNWQLVSEQCRSIKEACSITVKFCDALRLQLSPLKSWSWSTSSKGRSFLKCLKIHGDPIPTVEQATDLGAQICYSKRHRVGLIDQRCKSGVSKLRKIAALPTFRRRREQLILRSVWPETLHAAEIHSLSKTRLQTLRSRAAEALGFKKAGRNPWLACSVIPASPVDPQFVLVVNMVRLLRQVLSFEPSHVDQFRRRLSRTSEFPSLVTCLRDDLWKVGWECDAEFGCTDGDGRSFHLVVSNMRHILRLLTSSWFQVVAANVCHRKELTELETIDPDHSRRLSHFRHHERGLLEAQAVGEVFTQDKIGKFSGSASGVTCPFCQCEDSLTHRFQECQALKYVRDRHLVMQRIWPDIPDSARFYGLWPELPLCRFVQGHLDSIGFPVIHRVFNETPVALFTDGSCLHPKFPLIRLAASAVILAKGSWDHEVVWRGIVPSADQHVDRAEILAAAVACSAFRRASIYSDSKYVVQVARAILQQLRQGVNPQLPQTNLDCWLFFLNAVRGADLQYLDIVKVKAHQDWRQLQGVERCLVWYNGIVDTVAKSTARQFSQVLPGYSQLVQSFFQLQQNAEVIMWYHADIAWCATHDSKPEVNVSASVPLSASSFQGDGDEYWKPPSVQVDECEDSPHPKFMATLSKWLLQLRWFPSTGNGTFQDTSWLELMWFFVWSTNCSVPVLVEGKYVTRGETTDFVLVEPTTVQLLKTFRYFISRIEARFQSAFVPHVKVKTTASTAKLSWSQRTPGLTSRPCHESFCFHAAFVDLRRQLSTKTSVKRPNLSFRPDL